MKTTNLRKLADRTLGPPDPRTLAPRTVALALILFTAGCAHSRGSDVSPRSNALLLNHPIREVWDVTARLVSELNWNISTVDEDNWSLSTELMRMPTYGNDLWWDCGTSSTTVSDLESQTTRPRARQMVAIHQLRLVAIAEDTTAVSLTMRPHQLGNTSLRCLSRGQYERLFYEQVRAAVEEESSAGDE